jgi:hypothetical protein
MNIMEKKTHSQNEADALSARRCWPLKTPAIIAALLLSVSTGYCYGPAGHELVGAIADARLDREKADPKIAATVATLLDTLTLAEAAKLPDSIKTWDNKPGAKLPALKGHDEIDRQLRDFFQANKGPRDGENGEALHHTFHYTDVPIEAKSYSAGTKGRNSQDLVHMISYCSRVLGGQEPETNDRKITKAVALILLAHYLGDIHQPLHVGAEYFDENRLTAVNADLVDAALPDAGGNSLKVRLPGVSRSKRPKFHGFWDNEAVKAAKASLAEDVDSHVDPTDEEIALMLAREEPKRWKPSEAQPPDAWAEVWANEVLPLARDAHKKVEFKKLKKGDFHGEVVAEGEVVPKPNDEMSYEDWAGEQTKEQMHKAGWRLAFLIETLLH